MPRYGPKKAPAGPRKAAAGPKKATAGPLTKAWVAKKKANQSIFLVDLPYEVLARIMRFVEPVKETKGAKLKVYKKLSLLNRHLRPVATDAMFHSITVPVGGGDDDEKTLEFLASHPHLIRDTRCVFLKSHLVLEFFDPETGKSVAEKDHVMGKSYGRRLAPGPATRDFPELTRNIFGSLPKLGALSLDVRMALPAWLVDGDDDVGKDALNRLTSLTLHTARWNSELVPVTAAQFIAMCGSLKTLRINCNGQGCGADHTVRLALQAAAGLPGLRNLDMMRFGTQYHNCTGYDQQAGDWALGWYPEAIAEIHNHLPKLHSLGLYGNISLPQPSDDDDNDDGPPPSWDQPAKFSHVISRFTQLEKLVMTYEQRSDWNVMYAFDMDSDDEAGHGNGLIMATTADHERQFAMPSKKEWPPGAGPAGLFLDRCEALRSVSLVFKEKGLAYARGKAVTIGSKKFYDTVPVYEFKNPHYHVFVFCHKEKEFQEMHWL